MKRQLLKMRIWWHRHVPVPLLMVGTVVVLLLFLNDETSVSRNYEYQQEIVRLKEEIKLNNDSADFYKTKREALRASSPELEHIAREQYHMQKADEEVYIVK